MSARARRPLGGRDVLRELGHPPTLDAALAYHDLLAEHKPEKLERAAVRWHGRLETEATFLSLAESQLALAVLGRGAERAGPASSKRLAYRVMTWV